MISLATISKVRPMEDAHTAYSHVKRQRPCHSRMTKDEESRFPKKELDRVSGSWSGLSVPESSFVAEPVGMVTSKYWETGIPSRTSGRTGMGTRDLTSGGKIEEWAPDLFAAIGVGQSGTLLWGDLVPSVGPSFGAWRETSTVTIRQVQKRTRPALPWHLVFSNECCNGYNDHLGDSPHHVCVLSTLFCSSPAIHHTCYPSAMLRCPSTLILIAEFSSK